MGKKDKLRIELRLSPELVKMADDIAGVMGLRRNAFVATAMARMAAELTLIYIQAPGVKREQLLKILDRQLDHAKEEARKAL